MIILSGTLGVHVESGCCSPGKLQTRAYTISNDQDNGKGWTSEGRKKDFGACSCRYKTEKGLQVTEEPDRLKITPKRFNSVTPEDQGEEILGRRKFLSSSSNTEYIALKVSTVPFLKESIQE